jgi:hypothetical protein
VAEESEPCGYARRILPLPGRDEIQMILRCNRPKHEDGQSSQSMSGKRGNHRAILVDGVIVYFETEKPSEEKTK